jgi:hypothetical protein
MDTPGHTIGVEELTGYELQELRRLLGKPFPQALSEGDTDAMYAFVFISERRQHRELEFDDILARPFGEIMEAFQIDTDPTNAGSGDA